MNDNLARRTIGGLLALLACLAACRRSEQPAIGAVLPLTGASEVYGQWGREGLELAMADLQAQGQPFVLDLQDSRTDPKTGLSAFELLATRHADLAGVVTGVSGVVLAIAPRATALPQIVINHSAINPAIKKASPFVFSVVNDAESEAQYLVQHLSQAGVRQLGILYANASYGLSARDAVREAVRLAGGEVVAEEQHAEDAADFRSQITRLKSRGVTAAYLASSNRAAGLILAQAAQLEFRPTWWSYNAIEGPEVLSLAGAAAEGLTYTASMPLAELDSDPSRDFAKKYRERIGKEPNFYAATAYDAAVILARAYREGGGTARSRADWIRGLEHAPGSSGQITFAGRQLATRPLRLKTVRHGAFVYLPG